MSGRGKTIRLFFIEGVSSGRWRCELSNWTGVAYRIPRAMIPKCSDRKDLSNTGVYFLIGKTDDGTQNRIYVGEAENVLSRIYQHINNGEKEWQDWSDCVCFISKDDNLNKAMVKYLESSLYTLAKSCDRCYLENGNKPTKSSLSEMDENEMLEYLDNLRLLMAAMGYRFLEPMDTVTREDGSSGNFSITKKEEIKATGKVVDDGFLVLKGSKISEVVAESLKNKGHSDFRQKLIDNGTIENFIFKKDCLFSSCSAASTMVLGYNTNGWIEWKDENGRTLDECIRNGNSSE